MAPLDCLKPIQLGKTFCPAGRKSIAKAYYTPFYNLQTIAYAADSAGNSDEAEILAFDLKRSSPALPHELLQPINFVQLDDDSGALHEFEDKSENGNIIFDHTFTFKVSSDTPDEKAAIRKMLGLQIALVVEYKSGLRDVINHKGGLVVKSHKGDSNTAYQTVTASGKLNEAPLPLSFSDNGLWASTHLVPITQNPDGLVND